MAIIHQLTRIQRYKSRLTITFSEYGVIGLHRQRMELELGHIDQSSILMSINTSLFLSICCPYEANITRTQVDLHRLMFEIFEPHALLLKITAERIKTP
jgi:hypothetical protein